MNVYIYIENSCLSTNPVSLILIEKESKEDFIEVKSSL